MDWLEISKDANRIMKRELGVKPVKTKLKIYSSEAWDKFCPELGVRGIFQIHNLTANINTQPHGWISTVFHEYHGHGTFHEHSNHAKYINKENADNYYEKVEGFAVWVDYFLCDRLGLEHIWKKRKRPLDYRQRKGCMEVDRLVKNYGLKGMMRHRGFEV